MVESFRLYAATLAEDLGSDLARVDWEANRVQTDSFETETNSLVDKMSFLFQEVEIIKKNIIWASWSALL